jgi:hypothetical protein
LEDYFRAESGSDQQYLATHWNVPEAQRENIGFVIASVPDPVHTHMAMLFDRGIESIQKAAQASGYLFSRAWMPWDITTHPESTDFTVRLAQSEYRDKVESLPGLMIFQRPGRAAETQAPILFVFVVGETPTGGVHLEQFQNALNLRQNILGASKGFHGESRVLRLYGPTFSGSLTSLNTILNAQNHDQFSTILIRSGTISSYWAAHAFCELTLREWPDEKPGPNSVEPGNSGRPDFATFQFSDTYQEFYLSQFLIGRSHQHSRVAILSEDETAFGSQEQTETSTPRTPDRCQPLPPRRNLDPPFLRLYFPREIAQLREAYQRNIKIQDATQGVKNPSDNQLPLSLDATGNDDDSVGTYASLQTPLSQESILQSIVHSLRKEHVRIVVVRASDPLDIIFLCRYLRQNYPQGRLVTVGADLLMIHDLYDPKFHGILATSPYPLLNGAEFPKREQGSSDDAGEVHRLFPDSYSVGSFNAFLSLIAPDAVSMSADHQEPKELPDAGYVQFGLPSFLQPRAPSAYPRWRPHLWLGTVGRDGYWPVAVLDDLPSTDVQEDPKSEPIMREARLHPRPPERYSVHLSVGWTVFWILTVGFTALFSVLLWFPRAFTRSEILGRFGGQPFPTRNRLLFVGTLLLVASQSIFVFPAVIWLGRFSLAEAFGLPLIMGSYILSVGVLGLACYEGLKRREDPMLAKIGAWVCGSVIVVTLMLTGWFWSRDLGTRLGAFTYRYTDFGSGVSPCLPLLFLLGAWIWWCWQSLTGAASTQEKHVMLPNAIDLNTSNTLQAYDRVRLKALTRDASPIRSLGVTPPNLRITIPAVVGLAAIMMLMRPSEIAEAFETNSYKWTYWVLLYSCLFLVCYLVSHIVGLWLEFRTLLRSIDKLPFRRGFADLKTLTWKPLWKLAGNGRQEFIQLLSGELDALNRTHNSGLPDGSLLTAIQNVETAANNVSAEFEKVIDGAAGPGTSGKVRTGFDALQTSLAKAASESLIYANEQWKKEAFVPAEGTGKDSADAKTPIEPPAKDVTTRAIEHFLCLFYLNVILVPLRRLQTLILALAGVFVFVLISYSSYPFESRESFHVLLISIFFVISLVVGIVYGQMYADPLLGRITNTKPGELGLDFWVRMGTFAFVPLLSLLSVQFPSINSFLFSWLQPALQSIK